MKSREEEADGLEKVASYMLEYAKILRGEKLDYTGLGMYRITIDLLERVMDVKVISSNQYEDYVKLSDEDFKKRGGRTSY